jgi:hypothetical protein
MNTIILILSILNTIGIAVLLIINIKEFDILNTIKRYSRDLYNRF